MMKSSRCPHRAVRASNWLCLTAEHQFMKALTYHESPSLLQHLIDQFKSFVRNIHMATACVWINIPNSGGGLGFQSYGVMARSNRDGLELGAKEHIASILGNLGSRVGLVIRVTECDTSMNLYQVHADSYPRYILGLWICAQHITYLCISRT